MEPEFKCLRCGLHIEGFRHPSEDEEADKISHWKLKGLSSDQKNNLHMGPCTEKMTAIPVMIGAAAFALDVARGVGLVEPSGDGKDVSLLDATCGIGTSSVVFSMFFGKIGAGDYQQEQLDAARHNILNVFNLGKDPNVSVDQEPINVLDRKDIGKYNIVALEFNWGHDYHQRCTKGAYRMLVRRGKFDAQIWDDVWTTKDGPSRRGTVSLESLTTSILLPKEKTETMIVLLQVPDIYDFSYMQSEFGKQGLTMKIHDPTASHPASDISPDFLSQFEDVNGKHPRNRLINTFSEEYRRLHHYRSYHGEDRFVAVYRTRDARVPDLL